MSNRKYKRVLFIDEDKDVVNIYRSILERKKLSGQLIHMANAEEGINYLRQLRRKELPDYILLDVSLQGMGGLDFLRHFEALGKSGKAIEVFVCTSESSKDDRNKVMKFPFVSAFLEKPLPSDFLELLIQDGIRPVNG
ncbi:MAG: response regulator [Prolixibacteraceae bacterium]